MYTTYVIKNRRNKKYTGSTEDLDERLQVHNDVDPQKAKFHKTTFRKGPWKLFFRKDFETRKEALSFEKFLKTGKGRNWLERGRLGD